jgi:hypothetical protein
VPAAAAEGIRQLESRESIHPWHDRVVLPPRMTLQMDCKQCFLHDILRIDTSRRDPPSAKTADQRSRST